MVSVCPVVLGLVRTASLSSLTARGGGFELIHFIEVTANAEGLGQKKPQKLRVV